MSETGTTTEDLRPHLTPAPLPGHTLRRNARRYKLAGGITLAVTIVGTLTAAVFIGDRLWTTKAEFFFALAIIALAVAGGGLIQTGASKTSAAEAVDRMESTRKRVDQVAAEINDLALLVRTQISVTSPHASLLAETAKRLEGIETAIAEHLPEALRRQNWLGFRDAVEQGFAEMTGTDAAPRRRAQHLGLVPRDKSGNMP